MERALKIAGIWIVLLTLGYTLGKAFSPDFSRKSYVEDFIEQNSHASRFIVAKKTMAFNIPSITTLYSDTASRLSSNINRSLGVRFVNGYDTIRKVSFNAGRYIYTYTHDSDKVTRINNWSYDPVAHRSGIKADDFNKALVLAGLPIGYTLKDASSILKGQRSVVTAIAVITGLAGFGIGLYWGYDNDFNYGSEQAEKILNDVTFWKGVIMRKGETEAPLAFTGITLGAAVPFKDK